jgi:basic membrane lipoprotein Med (substrate-binding protein (PBP1-ABC) superfamily)
MSLTASGGTASVGTESADLDLSSKRVALVLPRDPTGADVSDPLVHYSARAFRRITTAWGQEVETFVIPEGADTEEGARDIVDADFDLVVVAGDGPGARALARLVRDSSSTRFAFIGPRLSDLGLAHARNAASYSFAEQESAQLAGYLSALVAPRREPAGRTPDLVSVVTGPRTPVVDRMVAGFRRGVKRASPKVRVRVDYIRDASDRTACETVANRQIDAGSDVVLALGRTCGSAALAVVRVRGVWGIRAEEDRIQDGEHILGTLSKYWDVSVQLPVNDLELDRFPGGKDIQIGLADDYAVLFLAEEEADVPEALWSKVVKYCSTIRRHTENDSIGVYRG